MDVTTQIGSRIKELREKRRLSQHRMVEEIKERIGHLEKFANYSQPTYHRLENNYVKCPDPLLIKAIAEILETSETYLFSMESDILSHLPENIRDFIADPDNAAIVIDAYCQLQRKRLRNRLFKIGGVI